MASNLSCLGFNITTEGQLRDLVLKLADKADFGLNCEAGDYVIWRSRTGAQLWFHLTDPDASNEGAREIVGLTPFFEGESCVRVKLTERFQRHGDTPFEGAFQAWVLPAKPSNGASATEIDFDQDGIYPVIFDCVDFAGHTRSALPAECEVRFTGFAREVQAHRNDDAFTAAQTGSPHPLAAQAFFPVGMFAAAAGEGGVQSQGDSPAQPSSHAMLTGKVVACAKLMNEETSAHYHWLRVESLDATFDVVADPDVVEGDITIGAIVQVACWMFGRILPDEG